MLCQVFSVDAGGIERWVVVSVCCGIELCHLELMLRKSNQLRGSMRLRFCIAPCVLLASEPSF